MDNSADKLGLAIQAMNNRDPDGADAVLEAILEVDPGQPSALRLSGVFACHRGKYQTAIDLMDRVRAVNPGDPVAYATRGEAFRALGDLSAAEQSLRHALSLKPERYDAHYNLALTLWPAGDHGQAATLFNQLLAQGNDSFVPNFYLAQYCFEAEDADAAEPYLRRAVEPNPLSEKSRHALGRIFFARGMMPAASEQFEAAVHLEPQDFDYRMSAAKANFELGRETRALAYVATE